MSTIEMVCTCRIISSFSRHLRLEQQLASGLSPFNVLFVIVSESVGRAVHEYTYVVCPCYLLQGIDLVDPHIQLVLENEIKELLSVGLKLFPSRDVVEESRSSNLEVLRRQSPARRQYSCPSLAARGLTQWLVAAPHHSHFQSSPSYPCAPDSPD